LEEAKIAIGTPAASRWSLIDRKRNSCYGYGSEVGTPVGTLPPGTYRIDVNGKLSANGDCNALRSAVVVLDKPAGFGTICNVYINPDGVVPVEQDFWNKSHPFWENQFVIALDTNNNADLATPGITPSNAGCVWLSPTEEANSIANHGSASNTTSIYRLD
jgi:hypothetical protein